MGANSGIGSAYPYGSPEFTPWFSVGFLLPDLLVFCAMLFDRFFFNLDHGIVFLSSIYASYYPFGIFKHCFTHLFFTIQCE